MVGVGDADLFDSESINSSSGRATLIPLLEKVTGMTSLETAVTSHERVTWWSKR